MEKKSAPVFKMRINKDDTSNQEVDYIALVDNPAIEVNWMAFSKQYKFTADKEKRIITGPLMIADMPIYRYGKIPMTDEVGEYYTVFDKQTVYDIAEKFFRNKLTDQFNIMHDGGQRTKGVYIIESILVDSTRGMAAPEAFKGINDGSWIVSVKVDNEEIWNDYVKTGTLKGFSVEGIFGIEADSIMETLKAMIRRNL